MQISIAQELESVPMF
ncbi:MAG: hypothetical protein AAF408_10265, partial [Pseudomonadota bacterium]